MRDWWWQSASLLIAAAVAGPAVAGGAAQQTLRQQATEHRSVQKQANQTSTTDQAAAKRWHLTIQQWHRYKQLKHGLAKYRSNRLDPLTLLGIHAESAAKRRAYAKKLARMEHNRVQGVLAFQKAYNAAFQKLYPDEKAVASTTAKRALASSRETRHKLDLNPKRTAVFVDVHDCDACNRKVKKMAAANKPMDIYVLDATDSDSAIQTWAEHLDLKPERVQSGRITLNHAPPRARKKLADQSLPRVINAGGSS
ncbi:TIGR03759 family integrating conjugative element protein [Salinisphaera orenii]|uniref:TIGR03759 family integrating conjugative element protein n=1 Tax=Salinisphaera orenii TaxID=856731 RepID=UPI000DBEA3CD